MERRKVNIRKHIDGQIETLLSGVTLDKESIIKIHKELLKGTPLTKQTYYRLSNLTKEKADEVLKKMGELDEQGNIVAYAGLSLKPSHHKYVVDGKVFYTWCAVDAILFSDWLDVCVHISSFDPINKMPIELNIEGDYLSWVNPYPVFVSWVEQTNICCHLRESLCNHVSFFASETTAKQWLRKNPNGLIIPLDDFFEFTHKFSCC